MNSIIQDYKLKAIHVFQVRTLKTLGFETRIALTNKSHNKGLYVTQYRIDVTSYSNDGKNNVYYENIAFLPIDSVVRLNCKEWEFNDGGDHVLIFHLIPIRFIESVRKDGNIDISRSELWSLFTAQDHHVEYYLSDGYSSGVLYQSGAFNYKKFSKEETTIIQAPKIYINANLDTLLSVVYTTFETHTKNEAMLECTLFDENGTEINQWTINIMPQTSKLISMKKILMENTEINVNNVELKKYTLIALCKNAALLPLILNYDSTESTIAVEHSLPPMYYGTSVTGNIRRKIINDLSDSSIF